MGENRLIIEKVASSYSEVSRYVPLKQYSGSNSWNLNNNGNWNQNTKSNTNRVRVVADSQSQSSSLSEFLDFASTMVEAYYKCYKTKRGNPNATFYALRGLTSTVTLAEQVWKGTYRIQGGIAFVILHPVPREVFAATFRDRIVHTWVIIRLEPIYEKVFQDSIFANRKGRGTLATVKASLEIAEKVSEGFTKDAWAISRDFKGFFMSIDKRTLNNEVQRLIGEHYEGRYETILRRLFEDITYNCPQDSAIRRSSPKMWDDLIPPEKTLYAQDRWHGLPIGNLPSQWSACVIVMLALRIFAKYGLEDCVNYMDDTIFFVDNKEVLKNMVPLEKELKDTLNITVHPKKRNVQHISKGWKIVGGMAKPHRLYIGRRCRNRMFAKLNYLCSVHDVDGTFKAVNSYFGLMIHYRTYNIRKRAAEKVCAEFGELAFSDDCSKVVYRAKYNPRKRALKAIRTVRSHKSIRGPHLTTEAPA